MRLRLVRQSYPTATLGDLYVDGIWICKTLEDIDRRLEVGGRKIKGDTAIPLGTYPVTIDFSQRFQKPLPHVLEVPQFVGIRIHAGNTVINTEGCVLVGQDVDGDTLVRSRLAMNELQPMIQEALHRGEMVTLTIERE